MDRVAKFLQDVVDAMGCDPADIDRPGVTVAGTETRAENHVTAGYKIGEHLFVTCDPAAEEMLADAVIGMEPTLEGWTSVADAAGGKFLGAGRMQLLQRHDLAVPTLPDGFEYRTLRSADDRSREMIAELVSASSEDDLDEAEIEMDELDDVIDVVINSDGQVVAYGSARSFDMAPDFGDIGALTRDGYRGQGFGVAAITALCVRLLAEGIEPLYRCGEENAASMALSASMGFEPATRIRGYRFPTEK